MILSAFATLLIALAAMMPGLILCRAERLTAAQLVAVAAASLAVSMMTTALLAVMSQWVTGVSLPAISLLAVSAALSLTASLRTRKARWSAPNIEWQLIAVAAIFVMQGVVVYALSIGDLPDGSLRIHAWYNADWFKHIGHTFAIADYGLPARDIFGNARPLHYYWLSHVLPGAGTSVGGDAWAALYTANVIYGALLAAALYGVVQLSGASRNISAVVATLATMICATPRTWVLLFQPGGYDAILFHGVPTEPAFTALALYIPQHAFALTLLLSWAILTLGEEAIQSSRRLLALAGLATVMTVSTLFGAAILATYGFTELSRRRLAAVPEVATMAIASVLLVFALAVITFGNPMPSAPLHDNLDPGSAANGGMLIRGIMAAIEPIGRTGLPILFCLYLLSRWKPDTSNERNAKIFALALVFTSVISAFSTEIMIGKLLAHEVRLRMINLIAVSTGIIGCWAVSRAWKNGIRTQILAIVILGVLTVAAAPTVVLRTLWHGNHRDNFTTIIPADDRKVLAVLKAESALQDIVWQYPENSLLSDKPGDDNWSAVLAGRANLATPRATDWTAAAHAVELAHRYFDGQSVTVPRGVAWIYLSRKLHPGSYDALVSRLDDDSDWAKDRCEQDACLFRRRSRQ